MIESRVYFVLRLSDGLVKIGVTRRLQKRLNELRRLYGEIHLLGDQPGIAHDERHLHRIFAHLRVFGEWFELDDDVLAYTVLLREPERMQDGPWHVYAQACVLRYGRALAVAA